jgi:5-hydroxyisourate hydrolase
VLDTALGRPAAGVPVTLERDGPDGKVEILGKGSTDTDGRLRDFARPIAPGIYRIRFETGVYFAALQVTGLYPEVTVTFEVRNADHYHIPLLLSPHGYTTYRGS